MSEFDWADETSWPRWARRLLVSTAPLSLFLFGAFILIAMTCGMVRVILWNLFDREWYKRMWS